jgi:hypothetical protein
LDYSNNERECRLEVVSEACFTIQSRRRHFEKKIKDRRDEK